MPTLKGFDEFINAATRTESVVDQSTKVDLVTLTSLLQAQSALGYLIDSFKKNIYYNKPISSTIWEANLGVLNSIELPSYENLPAVSQYQSIDIDFRLLHSIIGLITEGAELGEAVVSSFTQGNNLDTVNVREEIFDVLWYVLIGHSALDKHLEGTLDMGFEKLRARFPDKFSSDNAINRNLDIERTILESHN